MQYKTSGSIIYTLNIYMISTRPELFTKENISNGYILIFTISICRRSFNCKVYIRKNLVS